MISQKLRYYCIKTFRCQLIDDMGVSYRFSRGNNYPGTFIVSCVPEKFYKNFNINNPLNFDDGLTY